MPFTTSLILVCTTFITTAFANAVELTFKKAGLVAIQSIDSTIQVDLVNSDTRKNFFRKDFYQGLQTAYLRPIVAKKLSRAQKLLKESDPQYSLLILDAARPRSVSKLMYDQMKGTKFEKFVANPQKGSMHNYGIAVDVTIVRGKREIDMGFTPFRKSMPAIYWSYFLKKIGVKVSRKQKENRELLKKVMLKAGFLPLSYEWWHFNGLDKNKARKMYQIIE